MQIKRQQWNALTSTLAMLCLSLCAPVQTHASDDTTQTVTSQTTASGQTTATDDGGTWTGQSTTTNSNGGSTETQTDGSWKSNDDGTGSWQSKTTGEHTRPNAKET